VYTDSCQHEEKMKTYRVSGNQISTPVSMEADSVIAAARQFASNFVEDDREVDIHVEDIAAATSEDERGPVTTIRVRTSGRDVGENPWQNFAHIEAAWPV